MPPPRRRWFQVSLAEWLILTTLLGGAWWQCTRWPVADTVPAPIPKLTIGERLVGPLAAIPIKRRPIWQEVAVRGAISSVVIIGVWLVGSIAVRADLATATNSLVGHYLQSGSMDDALAYFNAEFDATPPVPHAPTKWSRQCLPQTLRDLSAWRADTRQTAS